MRRYVGPVATASHLRVSCFSLAHILALLGAWLKKEVDDTGEDEEASDGV